MARLSEKRFEENVSNDESQRSLLVRQPDVGRKIRRGHQLHPLLRRGQIFKYRSSTVFFKKQRLRS
jgi:hypothetical protein